MATIQFQLLGQFLLYCDSELVITIQQGRLQSLLAYLALHRRAPQSRRQLAFLFWPDSTEAQALTNLRKYLYYLRRALPAACRLLQNDSKTVQWQASVSFDLDVERFESVVSAATSLAGEPAIAALQQAIHLYQGDLLPGCYDEWVLPCREAWRAKYIQALEYLVLMLEDRRDYPAAIEAAQRLLRDDPLHETTYRRLMRLHALNHDHAAALQVYHKCVMVLQAELDVAPGPETRAAYHRLIDQDIPSTLRAKPSSMVADHPFVGRQAQWQLFQATWRQVMRGHAHFVLIAGEAGIGKTRLAEELLGWAEEQGIVTARTRAYAAEGSLAYAPVIEWLRTPALKARLLEVGETWLVELARLLPELLEERPELAALQPATESWQRHRLFEALARALLKDRQPRVLLLDDLQWCDQETLEWLHFLLRFEPQFRLLVVGTVRPEEIGWRHPLISMLTGLRNDQQLTEFELTALGTDDTAQLAQHLIGRPLPTDLAARLYRDTEGYPLYIVETVRANLQAWRSDLDNWIAQEEDRFTGLAPASLPPKIRAVIDSRLTQLSPLARKVADLSAVIGRSFSFAVLARAGDVTEDELVEGLDELLQRQILRERGVEDYDFSHDKFREAVYAKVSATRRRVMHRRIAQALETVHGAALDKVSSQIAAHYEQAGLAAQAVAAYGRAARAALGVYAHTEAIELFQKALSLLDTLPQDEDTKRQELAILSRLGPVLVGMRGFAGLQVDEVYLRAQRLTQELGEPPNPAVLRALAVVYVVRRAYAQTQMYGEQIMALAEQTGDQVNPVLYVEAHYVLGVNAFWLGGFIRCREHLEAAVARYDEKQHDIHTMFYSQDAGVVCLVRLAYVLWYLGYPEQAHQRCTQAVALARHFDHPFTLGYALIFAAWLHNDCRARTAMAVATEGLAISRQYSLEHWMPMGLVLQGHQLVEQGQVNVGIANIRAGITGFQKARIDLYLPYALATLAQACARDGAPEEGLGMLGEAIVSIDQHGDRWYEAEIHRLKGELLIQTGADDSAVEGCFRQALTLAQQQQAKSLELRAARSLARLWARQGKPQDARTLLSRVYGWFTEGFAMPDLQEARDILDELA